MKEYLDTKLKEYNKTDIYPFHMPGHKRTSLELGEPSLIDITEIEGFDNLHHAQGILKESQERAAALWQVKRSFYLVNGSSCGILAAICSQTTRGDKILMARNCHKSVYNSVLLRELKAEYLYPEITEFGIQGMISTKAVAEMLTHNPDAKAVIITSPTYDGVVSNIKKIAALVHARGIPLIVDEAHGAHFGFSEKLPVSASALGADIVIQSLHKTLPSLTQTAVLHICTDRVSEDEVKRYLDIFETSSPSYVFMAGIDYCVRTLKEQGEKLFLDYMKRLDRFYGDMKNLKHIQVLVRDALSEKEAYDLDPSKIIISVKGTAMSGPELYELLLKRYHLQMEMVSGFYVTAMTSIMDSEEGFLRLEKALIEIDGSLSIEKAIPFQADFIKSTYTQNKKCCEIWQAQGVQKETVDLEEASGNISGEFLYLYPPGIPILVPGEEICSEMITNITRLKAEGLRVEGLLDHENRRINIVKF